MKKLLAVLVALCIMSTLFSVTAFAADGAASPGAKLSAYIKQRGYDASTIKYGAFPENISSNSKVVCYKNRLYYILVSQAIASSNMDGSKEQIIYTNSSNGIYNLQVHAERIYWVERSYADAGSSWIKSMNLNGSGIKTIATGEDQFIVYGNKIVVRDANLDKANSPVEIVSYNLDGSGRKVLFTPSGDKALDLVPITENKLLERSGAYCPFGIKSDRVYYSASGVNYSVNLDGTGTKAESSVNYAGTGYGNPAAVTYGNMTISYKYSGSEGTSSVYVNNEVAFKVYKEITSLNVISPDYLYIVLSNDQSALISINPSIKKDVYVFVKDATGRLSVTSQAANIKAGVAEQSTAAPAASASPAASAASSKKVADCELLTEPETVDYNVGDRFKAEEISLRVNYSDGSTKDIKHGDIKFTANGTKVNSSYKFKEAGTKKMVVTWGEYEYKYKIVVG
ncbi:MAG: bacterial Ig-like domain-containing protein [Hydrogenoanaerobacterium sp.]